MSVTVSSGTTSLEVLVIYRPPGFKCFSMFMNKFSDLLDERLYTLSPFVITGDLNIHLDDLSSQHTRGFNDLIDRHGLRQLVTESTHDRGHILDVILVRNSDRLLHSRPRVILGISDHLAINCFLRFDKPKCDVSTFSSRNIKSINRNYFINDIKDSNIMSSASESVDAAVLRYNLGLGTLLDSQAPARTRKARSHQQSPWYSHDITEAKKERRRLERKWRENGKLEIHRQIFQTQRDRVNYLVSKAKRIYHTKLIEECGKDNKKLYNVANRLLNRKQASLLPTHYDGNLLVESFSNFHYKVKNIRECLHPIVIPPEPVTSSTLSTIQHTSADEVLSLLRKLPPKSCPSDPIPTTLLKECASTVAPIISQIINLSIDQATVPSVLKTALVRPLLKSRL
nr:uncharacterized protein LOC129272137 [Lytechinus pictus]